MGVPQKLMFYHGKYYKNGWFVGTPISGNPHFMVRHSISQLGKSWKIHGFAGSMLKAPPRVFASSNVGFFVGTAIVSHPETNPFLWGFPAWKYGWRIIVFLGLHFIGFTLWSSNMASILRFSFFSGPWVDPSTSRWFLWRHPIEHCIGSWRYIRWMHVNPFGHDQNGWDAGKSSI